MFVKYNNTHQFSDPRSFHPYHCKKGAPYSQAPRLNRIYSGNERFDKHCSDLERWLMGRGYNEKNDKGANIKSPRTFLERPS